MAARRQTPLALLGCWLAGLGAAGCGADDEPTAAPLPRAAVAELDKQLGSIERRFAFGACADIERDNRPAVRRTLARLPKTVDPDVRRALRQSFARLFELARRQCINDKPPPASTAPTPTATATTPPSLPAPAATEAAPTDTSETTPTDTSKTAPPTNTTKTTPPPPRPDRTGTQPTTPPTAPNRSDSGARAPTR